MAKYLMKHNKFTNIINKKAIVTKTVDKEITDNNFTDYSLELRTFGITVNDPYVFKLTIKKDNSIFNRLFKNNSKRTTTISDKEKNIELTLKLKSKTKIMKVVNVPLLDINMYMVPYVFYANQGNTETLKIVYNIDIRKSSFQDHVMKSFTNQEWMKSDKLAIIVRNKLDSLINEIYHKKLNSLLSTISDNQDYIYGISAVSPTEMSYYIEDDIEMNSVENRLSEYIDIDETK